MRYRDQLISVISVMVLLGIIIFILAIFSSHSYTLDLTSGKKFSLAPQSEKIMKNLKVKIIAKAFFRTPKDFQIMQDMLELYRGASPNFTYRFIDIQKEPNTAKLFKVTQPCTIVLRSEYGETLVSGVSEETLTNGVLKVSQKNAKALYFSTGHNEKSFDDLSVQGLNLFKGELEREGYSVNQINLMRTSRVPEDASVFLILGAEKDFLPQEIAQVKKYFISGGGVCILLEQEKLPRLEGFIKEYGLNIRNDMILDPFSKAQGSNYMSPIVVDYTNHPIVKDFRASTILPTCRSLDVLPYAESRKLLVIPVANTGKDSWGETDFGFLKSGIAKKESGKDIMGPLCTAAVIEHTISDVKKTGVGKKSHMFVCGDADFIRDSNFYSLGNRDFILNTIGYLSGEGELMAIRPKPADFMPFFLQQKQGNMLRWIFLIGLPLCVVITGVVVYFRRHGV